MRTITRNSMKTKVDIDDFLILIYWVKTYFTFEGKTFNYQHLLDQAETYNFSKTPFNVQIHPIDDLMIDSYKIYHKLKDTEEKFSKVLDNINSPYFDKDTVLNETKRYMSIFEDLVENYNYEDPEIKGIQIGFLSEKMSRFILAEEYEKAAEIKQTMLENHIYSTVDEINNVEKKCLKENMSKFITEEEYEKAAKMRDIINEL